MRLIDADALYEYITNKVGGVDCAVLLDDEIAPTVQTDRPHGEWNRHELFGSPWYTCSACNYHGRNDFNFCPNCGARMNKGEDTTGESL